MSSGDRMRPGGVDEDSGDEGHSGGQNRGVVHRGNRNGGDETLVCIYRSKGKG